MDSAKLIQILVFSLAAFIVLILVVSGFHFVRAVYGAQLAAQEQRRVLQMAIIAANAAREAHLPQLRQRSGVLVQQPDGTKEIAITVESGRIPGEARSSESPKCLGCA